MVPWIRANMFLWTLSAAFVIYGTLADPEVTNITSCESGRNYTLTNSTHGCCELNITCGPGTEPTYCNGSDNDPYGYCVKCPYYCSYPFGWSFNPGYLTLPYGYCRRQTYCSGRYATKYVFDGNSTHNSICQCLSGFYSSVPFVSLCFVNYHNCPAGQGVDYKGGCVDCIEGQTFSDRNDTIQECIPVTTCGDYECTLTKATVTSDTVCGPEQNVTSVDELVCGSMSVWNVTTTKYGVLIMTALSMYFTSAWNMWFQDVQGSQPK